ncbi:hypothetical protein [Sphingobium subterraneum]|uniref:Uncharacterized protein n=1 Tax=Sphingobium subterraneum TaxID=627688 RepID=A0A841J099_9SPHN|nr:hypothetical protein [Sphingobium subterraneum]MBB6122946.1 hypothetical protein [Sphingobium subterraneum]
MGRISIAIEKAQADEVQANAASEGVDAEIIEIKRFDGGVAIVAVVLPLLTATLPFITKMVLEQIRSKRHVVVKVDGIELRGLDADSASKILAQALEAKD